MAVVDIPSSLDLHSYSVNGVGVILPEEEFTRSYPAEGEYVGGVDYGYCFAKTYTLEEDQKEHFIQAARSYVEQVNPLMGFVAKETLEQEFCRHGDGNPHHRNISQRRNCPDRHFEFY